MSGLPGASKIPILGTLFRSKDFQRSETELVIIATPYLVRPVARSAISRPDDNFNPANDLESFFLGRVNRIYGRPRRSRPPAATTAMSASSTNRPGHAEAKRSSNQS